MNRQAINRSAKSFRQAARQLVDFMRTNGIKSLLLGLSGGADSVLTLHLLAEASRHLPELKLGISHANFNLRGEESLRDEKFVRELVDEYNKNATLFPNLTIKFYCKSFATESYSSDNHLSIEMAARELRHGWWDEILSGDHYQYIVTGHHANDNEETLLLNLLRGSSPHGLKGMSQLGDRIFRPLLFLYKGDILSLLNDFENEGNLTPALSKGYVTDSTNCDSDYRRNFLRNEIIPSLEKRWEGVHTALQTTIELQSEAAAIIESSIKNFLDSCSRLDSGEILWDELKGFPSPVTLIYHWLKSRGMTTAIAKEIARHIPAGDEAVSVAYGRQWSLPDGSRVLTTRDCIRLIPAEDIKGNAGSKFILSIPMMKTERVEIDKDMYDRIRSASPLEAYLPEDPSNNGAYKWRKPREGDRMKLFPRPGKGVRSKLVSDILREAGVPVPLREKILMLCNVKSGEIVWIPGIRRAGTDLITPGSSTAYHLTANLQPMGT